MRRGEMTKEEVKRKWLREEMSRLMKTKRGNYYTKRENDQMHDKHIRKKRKNKEKQSKNKEKENKNN